MKHLKQSLCYFITLLFCSLALQHASGQLVGTVQIGDTTYVGVYTITASDANSGDNMIFVSPRATVTVNPVEGYFTYPVWQGDIVMNAAGILVTPGITGTGGALNTELTLQGHLLGENDLTKEGAGDLTFTGDSNLADTNPNKYRGTLRLATGRVLVTGTGQLSSLSRIEMSAGTILDISGATNGQEVYNFYGTGTVALGGNDLTFGRDNANRTFAGVITGGTGSSLTKVGTGTSTFTADSTGFLGTISVNGGTLLVNGDMSGAGLTTIADGGTLGGRGILGDVTIEAGGTLAPSVLTPQSSLTNSPYTMTVGELDAQTGSTIVLRINDQSAFEQIRVDSIYGGTTWADVNLEISALAGDYSGAGVTITGPMITTDGTSDATTWNDWTIRQKFLNLDNTGKITRNSTFFRGYAQTHNQQEVARVLDLSGVGTNANMWEMMTRFSQITSATERLAVFNQMTGDLRAHAFTLGQWKTSQYGLAHLDLTEHGLSEKNSVWFQAIHQTTDFEGDGNASAYGISRTGGIVGSEEVIGDDTKFGFFVGFARPYIYNQGNSVESNDLQFGFYGGSRIHRFLDTKLFVGYGHQFYEQKRYITDPVLLADGPVQQIDSRYKGDSMSMSLEIGVPLEGGLFSLRPLAAIDSDLTWVYNTDETGSSGLEQRFAREFYEKTLARAGLTAQFGSVMYSTPLSLMGRAFYARQISGDSHTTSRAAFLGDTSQWMSIYGIEQGRDYMTGGLGVRWTISDSRSFYGDYDYTMSDRSRAHSASLGYMQKW